MQANTSWQTNAKILDFSVRYFRIDTWWFFCRGEKLVLKKKNLLHIYSLVMVDNDITYSTVTKDIYTTTRI